MIDHATIERILDAVEIVDVISEFVTLKKRGVNHMGLCPFHNEKTPSFSVSSAKGIFKCFGCGKGGNAVNFIMEHENLSYPEALKYLAKKYNIDIVEKELTAEEIEQQNERESLLVVTDYALKYFVDNLLNSEEGKAIGLTYFKERGYRDDIIEQFQLGYSPEKKDAFTQSARKNGFKAKYLVKAGLTIQKEDYEFDRFHGRVIFPIFSLSGRVIGFGGRILKPDKNTAKYINSPESEIYHKSRVLYGIFQAKKSIVQNEKCYLVEGYTDVISLHQTGIENVVASSGTALTVDQIRLIKRFTPNVTIIFDGDEAGIKASLRGIDLILEEGLNVKVVLLPEGEDPDSFSKKHSTTELTEFIDKNEKDFIHFKLKLLLDEVKDDPVKRAGLISDIVKSIAVIPNLITRSVYIKECGNMLNIDERVLYAETNKIRRKLAEQRYKRELYEEQQTEKQTSHTVQPQYENDGEILEKELIRLLLNYSNNTFLIETEDSKDKIETSVLEYIIHEIIHDELDFKNPIYKQIFEEIQYQTENDQNLNIKYFLSHPDSAISQLTIDLISPKYKESKFWKRTRNYIETEEDKIKQVVKETVMAFKNYKIQKLLEDLQKNLIQAHENQNNDEIERYYQQYIALSGLKIEIAKSLGKRTILK